MHLEDFENHLRKRDIPYQIGKGVNDKEIIEAETRLGLVFPDQVKQFYYSINGLSVIKPNLEIYPLSDLRLVNNLVEFALFDNEHKIGFSTKEINDAQQWDIINLQTDFLVTLTMASFWSNKVWAWILRNRPVWQKEIYT